MSLGPQLAVLAAGPARTLRDFRLPGDEPIYRALNGLGQPLVDALMVFASSRELGIASLLFAALWVVGGLRKHAVRPLAQAGVALLLVDQLGHQVLKPLVGRLRPCFALPPGSVRRLVDVANSGSLPSLHAANAFAVAVALTLAWPLVGRVLLPIAALIAISRVFVGVHWPSDVAAGALYGSAVALAIHLLVWLLRAARRPRPTRGAPQPPTS